MAVAKSDEGSAKTTRRKTYRSSKTEEPEAAAPAPEPVAAPPATARSNNGPPPPAAPPVTPGPPGLRLDDLYRLTMIKLFAAAEKEGITDHTGMSRAQLIVGIVRKQIERGEVVRGSGTLEVLPDGYGFLRSQAHNYLASPEDIYVSPSLIRR